MAKKTTPFPLSGWLNFDKPLHLSSNDAVQAVKRHLRPRKIGHGGTLDPLASGVLPLAVGEATKTVNYAMSDRKIYVAHIQFGQSTTTDDREGEVIAESALRPAKILIQRALHEMSGGPLMQRPPAFSALKVGGKRAYNLARAGQQPDLTPRQVWLYSARLMSYQDQVAIVEMEVGKGFYVRSFARDLGERLRSRAHLAGLKRTRVGSFALNDAISLDSFLSLDHRQAVAALLPLEFVLDDIPALVLGQAEAWRLKSGLPTALVRRSFLPQMANLKDGQIVRARYDNRLLALCEFSKARLKIVRGFN